MRGPSGKDHRGGQGHRRREAKGRSPVDGGGVAPPATVVVVVAVKGVHADGALAHRRGRPAAGEANASHPAARRRKEVSDDDATMMRMRRIMSAGEKPRADFTVLIQNTESKSIRVVFRHKNDFIVDRVGYR
jgi:hypothetical protein